MGSRSRSNQQPLRPHHKIGFDTMACKAFHATFFVLTMGCWANADGSSRLIVAEPRSQTLNGTAEAGPDLMRAIRDYVRAYMWRHGRRKTAEDLGVSRHTLWRFLEQGHVGRTVPSAVLNSVGGSVRAIEAATLEIVIDLEGLRPDPALRPLREGLEEALLLLCATPLTTVDELSRFGRVPASTLRERLGKLAERGLVDSVSHHLSVLGTRPQRRYVPTEKGVTAAGAATKGRVHMLRAYPGVEAVVPAAGRATGRRGRALPRRRHGRRRRPAPEARASGPLSPGSLRHADHPVWWPLLRPAAPGAGVLPTSRLRYRLRSVERLDSGETPFVTLVLAHSEPGHPPGHPLIGRPVRAPQDVRGDGGGSF